MKTRNVLLFCVTLIVVALILAPTNSRFPKVSSLVGFVKNWGPVIIPFIKDDQPPELPPAPQPSQEQIRYRQEMPDQLINGEPPRIPTPDGRIVLQHKDGW